MGQPLTVQEQKRVNEVIGMQDEAAAVEALERNFDSHVLDASSLSLVEGAWKLIAAHAGPKVNLAGNELGNDQLFNIAKDPRRANESRFSRIREGPNA